ncbi:hypothetical protein ACWDRR_42030 [Kitasatospora sp. NPDC003701]
MAHEVAGRAGRRPASSSPGSRRAGTAEHGLQLAVLEEELVQAGGGHSGDRAARLAADAEIVRRLRQVGFTGEPHQKVMGQLMQYGWNVITPWCATGTIFRQARAFGRPVPEAMITTLDRDDSHEIATETVLAGARLFHRHALVKGSWNPEGGASLTTYYVGACLLTFKAQYQRWHRRHIAPRNHLAGDDAEQVLAALPDQRAVDPLKAVVLRSQVTEALSRLTDPKVREGLVLRAAGYTQAEAAESVDLGTKAFESRLGRARARLRNDSASESINS